jgi:type II secretory pathway predicted ATPase ExeA
VYGGDSAPTGLKGLKVYEDFYGFRFKPFSKTPNPELLYMSRGHREALARLQYGVEERDIVLLTGEVGCGKTTLSRLLMDSLDDSYLQITIVGPMFVPGELLRHFAFRLGIENPGTFRMKLMEQVGSRLFEYYQNGICPVLIIDEAHLIPDKEGLDELRLLTNLQLDDANLFSLILIGQPELRNRLFTGYFEPFRQRIGIQYHLSPLNLVEVREYIEFRLTKAGRSEPLFTEAALKELFRFSNGMPRRINNLAAGALLEGFSRGTRIIDGDIVIEVAKDFGLVTWHP